MKDKEYFTKALNDMMRPVPHLFNEKQADFVADLLYKAYNTGIKDALTNEEKAKKLLENLNALGD